MIVLITGPVRSGKSTRAVALARAFGAPVTHVVTARVDPLDREMNDRVARHRAERGSDDTLELWDAAGGDLPAAVAAASPGRTLLVDSLGTWLAGHLLDMEALVESDPLAAQERLELRADPLVAQLRAARGDIVLVSEESGWGLVPVSAQGRIFRDVLGRINGRIAKIAARTELVVAGYAIDLARCGVRIDPAG